MRIFRLVQATVIVMLLACSGCRQRQSVEALLASAEEAIANTDNWEDSSLSSEKSEQIFEQTSSTIANDDRYTDSDLINRLLTSKSYNEAFILGRALKKRAYSFDTSSIEKLLLSAHITSRARLALFIHYQEDSQPERRLALVESLLTTKVEDIDKKRIWSFMIKKTPEVASYRFSPQAMKEAKRMNFFFPPKKP